MSQIKIDKLTPEQEALIPVYRQKWRAIALSTEPIDRQKAAEGLKVVYASMGLSEPKITFCDSPSAALITIQSLQKKHLGLLLARQLVWQLALQVVGQVQRSLGHKLWSELVQELEKQLENELFNELEGQLESELLNELEKPLENKVNNYFSSEIFACYGSYFDFCFAVLKCEDCKNQWQVIQCIARDSGWIVPFEKICFICDRPRQLSFDSEQRLHAEGEPAIQFADGYSLYSYHGITLPEEYGKLHPSQWQPQWLLKEDNAELRRVLIQGIGYSRICQELQATELDSWQEYTLLRIDADIDGFEPDDDAPQKEPIYLLKMTCPSTGHIHSLRVPPNMKSAREAIRWVNWGIEPEEFSVQT